MIQRFMETTIKIPLTDRINLRMLAFFGVLIVLVGYPIYIYVDSAIHHGIKQTSEGMEVDLKAMSLFPFDQVNGTIDDVPKQWRDLDGKKVVTYGEMWNDQYAGRYVDSFELVYSIAKCCFNGPPQVQHFVHATAVKGKDLEYYQGLVKVKGTLHVDVTHDAGKVNHVYWMDAESVEPM